MSIMKYDIVSSGEAPVLSHLRFSPNRRIIQAETKCYLKSNKKATRKCYSKINFFYLPTQFLSENYTKQSLFRPNKGTYLFDSPNNF